MAAILFELVTAISSIIVFTSLRMHGRAHCSARLEEVGELHALEAELRELAPADCLDEGSREAALEAWTRCEPCRVAFARHRLVNHVVRLTASDAEQEEAGTRVLLELAALPEDERRARRLVGAVAAGAGLTDARWKPAITAFREHRQDEPLFVAGAPTLFVVLDADAVPATGP